MSISKVLLLVILALHSFCLHAQNLTGVNLLSDSERADQYYDEFLKEYQHDYHGGKEDLLKAIELYENTSDKKRLAELYRLYLKIYKYGYFGYNDEDKAIVIKLFRNGVFGASDYIELHDLYVAECQDDDMRIQQHKIDSLTAELQMQGINPPFFATYVKYITADLTSLTFSGSVVGNNSDHDKRNALILYTECIGEYDAYRKEQHYNPEYIDLLEAYCLDRVVSIYADLQMYDIAAIYQKRYLDLINKWWKSWGVESPWHAHEDILNHGLFAYENYMDYLFRSNQYSKGIDYSEEVLKEIDNYEIDGGAECVISWIENLSNPESQENYKDHRYTKGTNNIRLASLYAGKNYDKLNEVADSILSVNAVWMADDVTENYIGSFLNDESIKSTHEQDLLFAKRSMWWYAIGISEYWEALMYKALVAMHNGDVEQAIKYQEEVVDIVKIDYEFDPGSRSELLGNHNYMYLSPEIFQYLYLAQYYFIGKRNEDAIVCLNRALNTTVDIMSIALSGSYYAKKDWCDDTYEVLNEIMAVALDNYDNCPETADVVLEVFSLMNGVRQNETISLRNAISDYGGPQDVKKKLEQKYKEKLQYDRKIDLTYYGDAEFEREDLMTKRALCQVYIDDNIDEKQIIKSFRVSVGELKNTLYEGDLYLHMMNFSVPGDSKYVLVDSLDNDLYRAIEINKSIIYAVAYKPEWQHARIIRVCDNFSPIGDSLSVLAKYTETDPANIFKFYTSTVATDFVWDRILKEANLKEGSNVYFIPAGVLMDIAIEQMQMKSGQRVCDKYKCYRLTSAHEIGEKGKPYKKGDNAAIFYDLDYDWVDSLDELPAFKENLTKVDDAKINDALERMFSQDLKHYAGSSGTESELISMSGNSPAYLHFSTHGFLVYDELSDKELDYLIGHRMEYMPEIEESMFRTGMYMSSSEKEKGDSSNDGLLTSNEIGLLDLSGTKLCVLSACSTASGRHSLEGVFGLQRAFKLAGVKALLVSLWDVDSESTELLMSKFYGYLSQGFSLLESLQKGQMDIKNYQSEDSYKYGLDTKIYENPYYWAGFILLDAN